MPELPETTVMAKQMNKELTGKRITEIEVRQPKNLNMPISEFVEKTKEKRINNVSSKGKWLFIELDSPYYLLINRGMNADVLYFRQSQSLPPKYQFKLVFNDKTGFTIQFQWFGYIHLVSKTDQSKHKLTGKLGTVPTDDTFTRSHFQRLLADRRAQIKNFLLNQKNVAGIGNVYIQDILFKAKLHPNRKISTLSRKEVNDLYDAMQDVLIRSIKLGGLAYEKDFYGHRGRFSTKHFLVGYKTGKPCPTCATSIEKIKTGSTSSYICPKCQPLN